MSTGQFEVVAKAAPTAGQSLGKVAFFDKDGNPVAIGGGGGEGGPIVAADITDATAIGRGVLTAATVGDARTAIGAGTSSLAVSTAAPAALAATAAVGTGTTAARADHVHAFPTATQVGAAPTTHTHTAAQSSVVAGATLTGATVQLALEAMAARVAVLEAAQA